MSGGDAVCPLCGSALKVRSTKNPLRNVERVYVKCGRCGFERSFERPPEATLGEWLKGVLEKEGRGGVTA